MHNYRRDAPVLQVEYCIMRQPPGLYARTCIWRVIRVAQFLAGPIEERARAPLRDALGSLGGNISRPAVVHLDSRETLWEAKRVRPCRRRSQIETETEPPTPIRRRAMGALWSPLLLVQQIRRQVCQVKSEDVPHTRARRTGGRTDGRKGTKALILIRMRERIFSAWQAGRLS